MARHKLISINILRILIIIQRSVRIIKYINISFCIFDQCIQIALKSKSRLKTYTGFLQKIITNMWSRISCWSNTFSSIYQFILFISVPPIFALNAHIYCTFCSTFIFFLMNWYVPIYLLYWCWFMYRIIGIIILTDLNRVRSDVIMFRQPAWWHMFFWQLSTNIAFSGNYVCWYHLIASLKINTTTTTIIYKLYSYKNHKFKWKRLE